MSIFTDSNLTLAKSGISVVELPALPSAKPPEGYTDVIIPLGTADRRMRRKGYKCDVLRVARSSLIKRNQTGK